MMPGDSLMSSLRVPCFVVTWATASVTNFAPSIRDPGANPSVSTAVNSKLIFPRCALAPVVGFCSESKGRNTITA